MPTRVKFALLATLLLACCSFAWAEKIADIRPEGYVTDLAHVIDPATKAKLEALCAEVEHKTGAQVAVVTVDSLDGQSKEDYAADLYKHLGVGSKKENRGVLDVLQLSRLLAGDVKESRNDSPTRDLQMAADRTRPHTLCGPVVSSLLSFAARC